MMIVKRRRSRTKQTLQAPRHIDRDAEQKIKSMVWVTIGKTEHQAWLLEDVKGKNIVSIRWETTGSEQRVPVLSIRHEAPENGRRSLRRRTSVQDSFQNQNGASFQASRKRKKRQINNKAKEKIEKATKQNDQSDVQGSANLEGRVKSNRLAWGQTPTAGLAPLVDTMMPNNQGILLEGKVSGEKKSIQKVSLPESSKGKASAYSEIWENAKQAALSTYADQKPASAITKSAKGPKAVESISGVSGL